MLRAGRNSDLLLVAQGPDRIYRGRPIRRDEPRCQRHGGEYNNGDDHHHRPALDGARCRPHQPGEIGRGARVHRRPEQLVGDPQHVGTD